ncbi:DUF1643 domain-containing protein [Dyadobacter sp. Leaf189]|uniref:DUF1643 domain-containing protein n=1 Tax=Dyadobacter sp. Leaf189 TaxID=1736295 RepID=UPI0006FCCBA1|nr:DUF1643 domain-containing protein [Dyadobacter sp. Leaf189]KQS33991.1 hypothetical protein ASG33_08140 [Dyadobacter sp. Leaf189]
MTGQLSIFEDTSIVEAGAEISECGQYRYKLWRIWDKRKPLILWIMHNPSKADSVSDDPTINRVTDFSKRWGFGGFYVGNLFPYRETNPDILKGINIEELIPHENCLAINEMIALCDFHLLAHGNPVVNPGRWQHVAKWHYLKLTKSGNPGHPLYLKANLKPIPF